MAQANEFESWDKGKGFAFFPVASSEYRLRIGLDFWSPEVETAISDSQVSDVLIQPWWREEEGKGPSFLTKYADQIRHLHVSAEFSDNWSWVSELQQLETLSTACPVEGIDFSKLAALRECEIDHGGGLGNLHECTGLEKLSLGKARVRELEALRSLKNVRRLWLSEMRSLRSIDGVEAMPLEELSLAYLPRLDTIRPAAMLSTLRELTIDHCRAVTDTPRIGELKHLRSLHLTAGPALESLDFVTGMRELEQVGIWEMKSERSSVSAAPLAVLPKLRELKLARDVRRLTEIESLGDSKSLEVLMIDRGPRLKSLNFLRGMTNLREFLLNSTTIEDGDLTALLDLPRLVHVHQISPRMKHYSHTDRQINALLSDSRRSAGGQWWLLPLDCDRVT